MASFTGTKIKDTYPSILKVFDNGALDGTVQVITDGLGNSSALQLGTAAANIQGTMAVTGNFTVDTDTLRVDTTQDRVGINVGSPTEALDVLGNIKASGTLALSGAATLSTSLEVVGNQFSENGDISLTNGDLNLTNGDLITGGKIVHLGDTNTYFNFPSADNIELVTGGTQRFLVNNAGATITGGLGVSGDYSSTNGRISLTNGDIEVGGGISIANSLSLASFSPNANLLVIGDTGSGANQGMTIVSPTGSTGNIYFSDGTAGSQLYRGYVTYNHNSEKMFLGVNATDLVEIDSVSAKVNGNLVTTGSITGGTFNATSLNVSGNVTFDTNVYVGGVVANVDDLDTNISFGTNQISLITGGLTRLSASDASVQVTNPLVASSTLAVTGDAAFNIDTLFVDVSADRVGVNTNTPTEALDVVGNIKASGTLEVTGVSTLTGNVGIGTGTITGYSNKILHIAGTDGAELHITTNGSGGLQSDGLSIGLRDSDGSVQISQRDNSFMAFATNDTERMRIKSDGDISFRDSSANEAFYWDASAARLGIGTNNPSSAIQIYRTAYSGNQFKTYAELSSAPTILNYTTSDGMGLILNMYEAVAGVPYTRYADIVANTGDVSDSAMRFFTKPYSGNAEERMRIDSSGNVFFNDLRGLSGGDVRLSTNTSGSANIVFATGAGSGTERMRILSSGGITFNGDTSTANALDDYEEGTWTPTVAFGGASVGLTYSFSEGRYTKIGNKVTLNCFFSVSDKGSSTGVLSIGGFPFALGNTTSNFCPAVLRPNGVSFADQMIAYAEAVSTQANIQEMSSAGAVTDITNADCNTSFSFMFQITYFV